MWELLIIISNNSTLTNYAQSTCKEAGHIPSVLYLSIAVKILVTLVPTPYACLINLSQATSAIIPLLTIPSHFHNFSQKLYTLLTLPCLESLYSLAGFFLLIPTWYLYHRSWRVLGLEDNVSTSRLGGPLPTHHCLQARPEYLVQPQHPLFQGPQWQQNGVLVLKQGGQYWC